MDMPLVCVLQSDVSHAMKVYQSRRDARRDVQCKSVGQGVGGTRLFLRM